MKLKKEIKIDETNIDFNYIVKHLYSSDCIKVIEVTGNRSLNANSHGYLGFTRPTTPTGYTPLTNGFITYAKGNQDTSQILVGGGGTMCHIYNYASVSQTITVTMTYLFVKLS